MYIKIKYKDKKNIFLPDLPVSLFFFTSDKVLNIHHAFLRKWLEEEKDCLLLKSTARLMRSVFEKVLKMKVGKKAEPQE